MQCQSECGERRADGETGLFVQRSQTLSWAERKVMAELNHPELQLLEFRSSREIRFEAATKWGRSRAHPRFPRMRPTTRRERAARQANALVTEKFCSPRT